jgi:hypothetical protein
LCGCEGPLAAPAATLLQLPAILFLLAVKTILALAITLTRAAEIRFRTMVLAAIARLAFVIFALPLVVIIRRSASCAHAGALSNGRPCYSNRGTTIAVPAVNIPLRLVPGALLFARSLLGLA